MRKVIYGGAMSLDGYIAGPRGEYDWIVPDPEMDFAAMAARFDTYLIGRKTFEYGAWVRENTPPDAVFAAGSFAGTWIPVLAGRQILVAADRRPPPDWAARKHVERTLILSHDPARIRQAAARYGITHLALDKDTIDSYGEEQVLALDHVPVYERVFLSSAVRIYRIRPE